MRRVEVDGKVMYEVLGSLMTEAEFDAAFSPTAPEPTSLIGWKDIHSEALAYHPDQIAEAHEHLKKLDVDTHIDPQGRPVFTSRQQRAKFLKANGYFDRDAGYGDPADGSFRDHREPKKVEMFDGK